MAQSVSDEPSSEDQTRLVQQFCLGDRSAFAALVQIWEHRLLTIAYRVVGNLHDAEEVRQNVLLKLAQSPISSAILLALQAGCDAVLSMRRSHGSVAGGPRPSGTEEIWMTQSHVGHCRPLSRLSPPNGRSGCCKRSASLILIHVHCFRCGLTNV